VAEQRPWHGASDRADEPAVAALRAQRAEVDALIAFSHAAEGETKAVAWWRLHRARLARGALLGTAQAARLPALPAPPRGAFSAWQQAALRIGLLRLDRAAPPSRIARRLA
jgi:hypothetical protein